MFRLNLPEIELNIKKTKSGFQIMDVFRNRFVKLTPEEWVRQNFLHFLVNHKSYPIGLIAVETELNVSGLKKRCDAVVYNQKAEAILIVEFKAPNVPITQEVFEQVAIYNMKLNVDYFMISNGIEHYFYKMDRASNKYQFYDEIVDYKNL